MVTDDHIKGEKVTINVPDLIDRERLDKYLGGHTGLDVSRSRIQKLINEGLILVDGAVVLGKHPLTGGEEIEITIPPEATTELVAEDIPLDIVYEDSHLVVINKPAGMVIHPAKGNQSGTLVNALVFHFKELAQRSGRDRPGIVHRLDKNTSGLLVVARDDQTHLALQKAISDRTLKRTYLGVVCGHMPDDEGEINLPIGRSTRDRTKMAVTSVGSREATTKYRVMDRFRSYDLLEIQLMTGRTHQIRVHFSHLGHPVFGDPDYGGRELSLRGLFGPERPLGKRLLKEMSRQALHAARLEFEYPLERDSDSASGRILKFETEPPEDFRAFTDLLLSEGH